MIENIYTVILAVLVSVVTFLWLVHRKLAEELSNFECLGSVSGMTPDERAGYIKVLRKILEFPKNMLGVTQETLDRAVYESNIASLLERLKGKSDRSEVNKALTEFVLDNKKHEKQFHLPPGVKIDNWTFEAMYEALTGNEWNNGCD